jgi:hypothetical protein
MSTTDFQDWPMESIERAIRRYRSTLRLAGMEPAVTNQRAAYGCVERLRELEAEAKRRARTDRPSP